MRDTPAPALVWSVDASPADLQAAQALGVRACAVRAGQPAPHGVPAVVTSGLPASAERAVDLARWIDRLRAERPVAFVLDPASGAVADAAQAQAIRRELLPRASLVTPDRARAALLLGLDADAADASPAQAPALARALREAGAAAVCLRGGNGGGAEPDYLLAAHARGWLTRPRTATPHPGAACAGFAAAAAAALARGFVAADAVVLATMAGSAGFVPRRDRLPALSIDDVLPPPLPAARDGASPGLDLYAIVDSAARVQAVLAAGIRTVQLRIKADGSMPPARLRGEVAAAVGAARSAGARLFINDHLDLALELGAPGVHLGQEDLLALDAGRRQRLRASGIALGLSSHSLWELCRAASMQPAYVACGPVWPTLTKAMPWRAQGLDNLAWWVAMAPAPVVAIGGILEPAHVEAAARCRPDGVCVVRGLGDDPHATVAAFAAALARGRAAPAEPVPALPHPSLP